MELFKDLFNIFLVLNILFCVIGITSTFYEDKLSLKIRKICFVYVKIAFVFLVILLPCYLLYSVL